MKQILFLALSMITVFAATAQDKPKSPPATATAQLNSGATITINYSQPSVRGRKIGKDLEPLPGVVWRTGANKATVFETSKDITVEGKALPAGKYALFTLVDGDNWTVIFNKTWDQWGAFKYKEADDALRVNAKAAKAAQFAETLTFNIDKGGVVSILWGESKVDFTVK